MNRVEALGLWALHQLDPEVAHGLSLKALAAYPGKPGVFTSTRLKTSVGGIDLENPIGLAAGYDKNAVALPALSKMGFGFLDVGAATPRPQPGNPKPRLFRLTKDQAVINRFGFNNDGVKAIASRLAANPTPIPRGLNLGANKDSLDRAADFGQVLQVAGPHIDFATVNVSSPNTENLRDLQGKAALEALLGQVQEANAKLENPIPIFLKIAPDLSEGEVQDISDLTLVNRLAAIIATNTTLDRESLNSQHGSEKGGLSGAPLFEKSTRVLAQFAEATKGQIDLIGVGGIGSAAQALAKIEAGASAIQLYSAMVYKGIGLIPDIAKGLDQMLASEGAASIAGIVGRKSAELA